MECCVNALVTSFKETILAECPGMIKRNETESEYGRTAPTKGSASSGLHQEIALTKPPCVAPVGHPCVLPRQLLSPCEMIRCGLSLVIMCGPTVQVVDEETEKYNQVLNHLFKPATSLK